MREHELEQVLGVAQVDVDRAERDGEGGAQDQQDDDGHAERGK